VVAILLLPKVWLTWLIAIKSVRIVFTTVLIKLEGFQAFKQQLIFFSCSNFWILINHLLVVFPKALRSETYWFTNTLADRPPSYARS
jgi:hypothetical protein